MRKVLIVGLAAGLTRAMAETIRAAETAAIEADKVLPRIFVAEPSKASIKRRKDQGGMATPVDVAPWYYRSDRKGKGEKARNRSNRRGKDWI